MHLQHKLKQNNKLKPRVKLGKAASLNMEIGLELNEINLDHIKLLELL